MWGSLVTIADPVSKRAIGEAANWPSTCWWHLYFVDRQTETKKKTKNRNKVSWAILRQWKPRFGFPSGRPREPSGNNVSWLPLSASRLGFHLCPATTTELVDFMRWTSLLLFLLFPIFFFFCWLVSFLFYVRTYVRTYIPNIPYWKVLFICTTHPSQDKTELTWMIDRRASLGLRRFIKSLSRICLARNTVCYSSYSRWTAAVSVAIFMSSPHYTIPLAATTSNWFQGLRFLLAFPISSGILGTHPLFPQPKLVRQEGYESSWYDVRGRYRPVWHPMPRSISGWLPGHAGPRRKKEKGKEPAPNKQRCIVLCDRIQLERCSGSRLQISPRDRRAWSPCLLFLFSCRGASVTTWCNADAMQQAKRKEKEKEKKRCQRKKGKTDTKRALLPSSKVNKWLTSRQYDHPDGDNWKWAAHSNANEIDTSSRRERERYGR